MKQEILPSVMAKSQKEMNILFKKLINSSTHLHLDVADGKFVPNKSLWFPFKLSSKFNYSVHLMIKNPGAWIEKNGKKVNLIIFHPEAEDDVNLIIDKIKSKKKKIGLALRPETKVKDIKHYLSNFD